MLGGIITDACTLLYRFLNNDEVVANVFDALNELLSNHHNLFCLLIKNEKMFYATATLNLAATGEAGAIQNLYFNVPATHDIYMTDREAIAINTSAQANINIKITLHNNSNIANGDPVTIRNRNHQSSVDSVGAIFLNGDVTAYGDDVDLPTRLIAQKLAIATDKSLRAYLMKLSTQYSLKVENLLNQATELTLFWLWHEIEK